MTNQQKIKELLAEISSLLVEETKDVAITETMSLSVKGEDEPEKMTWISAMEKFGPYGTDKTWRLPTKLELSIMVYKKELIPNIKQDEFYWSSTEYSNFSAWIERFSDGTQYDTTKGNACYVRTVRR